MSRSIPEHFETVAPTEADELLARESGRLLAAREPGRGSSVRIPLLDGEGAAEVVAAPSSGLRLFRRLLEEMSRGHAAALVPTHAGAPCKGAGLPRVQSPPGNWVAPAGSNRSGGGGNEAAGAFDAKGRPAAPRAGRP